MNRAVGFGAAADGEASSRDELVSAEVLSLLFLALSWPGEDRGGGGGAARGPGGAAGGVR